MSEMVDRIAGAIAATELGMAVADQYIAPLAMEAARAVIQAMREPTDAMIETVWPEGASAYSIADIPQSMWPAMIDAALTD